jgi:hypothetical protein
VKGLQAIKHPLIGRSPNDLKALAIGPNNIAREPSVVFTVRLQAIEFEIFEADFH